MSFVTSGESFFEYHVASLVESVEKTDSWGERGVPVLDVFLIHQEIEIVRPIDFLRLDLRPRLVADRDKGQPRRGHQALLTGRHTNIHIPIINRQFIAAQN